MIVSPQRPLGAILWTSFFLAVGVGCLQALTNMLPPTRWRGELILGVGLLLGSVLVGTLYQYVWRRYSCLVDVVVLGTALLAALVGIAVHFFLCRFLAGATSTSQLGEVLVSCSGNYRRASASVNLLSMFTATFLVWMAGRFFGWRFRGGE